MTKKIISKILGIFVFASIFTPIQAFAAFEDVKMAHPYYPAISYLKENNIIHGYPDGTFRPQNEINRAEFLKIILEGSGVPSNVITPTPFPDVDHTAWYAPFVKKAYAEGWIEGYPDGTFKPSQRINKVEAIKILGEVQNWQLPSVILQAPYDDTSPDAWYTPYISYAKQRSFLEEEGPLYNPGALMTRGQISEVIFRTLTLEDHDWKIPEEEKVTVEFTPVDFRLMSTTFFRDITLNEEFPTHFYNDEIYFISGQVNSDLIKKVTVILEKENGAKRKTFSGPTQNRNFSIPVYFKDPGNHLLGIIPGEAGSGTAVQISVFNDLPQVNLSTDPPETVTNQQIYFSNGSTNVEFNAPPNTIKKISFSQDYNTVDYFIRQDETKVPVRYADFKDFKAKDTTYSISTAFISSKKPLEISSGFNSPQTRTFRATQHNFSDIKENEITANPPEVLSTVRQISFSGTAKADLKYNAYVIKPDGFVENVPLSTTSHTYSHFGSTIISAGGTFTYNYTPRTSGIYIVEINNINGEPALNHTVYIATGIPLLPDFFDLFERRSFEGILDLSAARTEMLNLINNGRQEHGLSPVTISTELNDVAQKHSQDMADNNFFGHINLQGQTPEDRRIEAGIKTPVGENLAKDTSVISAHYGLMRSASHRQNILTSQWTRVGIGIVQKNGQLLITQIFSISELKTDDLANMENELFTEINNSRNAKQVSSLEHSENLKSAANYINQKVINEGATLDNALFNEALSSAGVTGSSKLVGRVSSNWSTILNSIIDEEADINNKKWTRAGIDIQIDSTGNIHTMLILNNPTQ